MRRVDLFVIDGQVDFLDPQGALCVAGADKEAVVLADMIKSLKTSNGHALSFIHETLDSHNLMDIAHNVAWKGSDGRCPNPFTIVSPEDVETQKWVPRLQGIFLNDKGERLNSWEYAKYYTRSLQKRGRNPLCLWPPHCLIGTPGSCVYGVLNEAYDDWCMATGRQIDFVTKGVNPATEHYSAIEADVPYYGDNSTRLNVPLIESADRAELIGWAGWAGSHCEKWTGTDAVNHFTEDPPGSGSNAFLRKSVFITDCCAPVVSPDPGMTAMFAKWRTDFLAEMERRGAKLATTAQFAKMAAA